MPRLQLLDEAGVGGVLGGGLVVETAAADGLLLDDGGIGVAPEAVDDAGPAGAVAISILVSLGAGAGGVAAAILLDDLLLGVGGNLARHDGRRVVRDVVWWRRGWIGK